MTVYQETPSGGAEVGGCVTEEVTYAFPTTFVAGDIAYNKRKATNGGIERVGIKDVLLVNPEDSVVQGLRVTARLYVNYRDTYNGLWMQSELITEAEALTLIAAYEERIAAQKELLELCT